MIIRFALNLTSEAITLLHHSDGGWWGLGKAEFDDPNFGQALAELQQLSERIGGPDVATKLILPNSQIYYTNAPAAGNDAENAARVDEAVDGATPYALKDLVKDYRVDGDRLQIAVVAQQTLDEAETFVAKHGFNPVSFAAAPDTAEFAGEAYFGLTRDADTLGIEAERAETAFAVAGQLDKAALSALIAEGSDGASGAAEEINSPQVASTFAKTDVQQVEAISVPAEEKPVSDQELIDTESAVAEDEPATETVDELTASASPENTLADEGPTEPEPEPEPEPEEDATPVSFSTIRRREPALTAPQGPDEDPGAIPSTVKLGGASRSDSDPVEPSTIPVPGALQRALAERAARAAAMSPPIDQGADKSTHSRFGKAGAAPFGDLDLSAPAPKKSRLGLMMTVGLLGILAGAGVWSSLWLTSGSEDAELVAESQITDTVGTAPTVADAVMPPAEPIVTPDVNDVQLASLSEAPTSSRPNLPTVTEPEFVDEPELVDQPDLAENPEPVVEEDLAEEPELVEEPGPKDDPAIDVAVAAPKLETVEEEPLSDDSDLDLVDVEPVIPTFAEVETAYQETGIWQQIPARYFLPEEEEVESLYVTSIDPELDLRDAIALPDIALKPTDTALGPVANPTPADTPIVLVEPTPEGTLAPEGHMVFAGQPEIVPPRRPDGVGDPVIEPEPNVGQDLSSYTPRQRPANLLEQVERSTFGGRSLQELATLKPRTRPASIAEEAAAIRAALAAAQREADERAQREAEELAEKLAAEAQAEAEGQSSDLAVARSRVPEDRPRSVVRRAERQRTSDDSAIRASASTATGRQGPAVTRSQRLQPKLPTPTSVAQRATVKDALRLNRVNLIGVFGTASQRRALVRLPSGKLVRVKIGDRVDGGRVAAIGDQELRYVKGGRNVVLTMPRDG